MNNKSKIEKICRKIGDEIRNKIMDKAILDSEIIQEMESAKKIPGFDINLGCDGVNCSLLIYATYYCREDLVRYLLTDPNININHRSNYNSTILHYCKDISILKIFLSHRDLDVNIQNIWGYTGLHWVCYWERETCIREYLLDARINTSIHDKFGYPGIAKIIGILGYTTLLRIPNKALCKDIVRLIIEEYT